MSVLLLPFKFSMPTYLTQVADDSIHLSTAHRKRPSRKSGAPTSLITFHSTPPRRPGFSCMKSPFQSALRYLNFTFTYTWLELIDYFFFFPLQGQIREQDRRWREERTAAPFSFGSGSESVGRLENVVSWTWTPVLRGTRQGQVLEVCLGLPYSIGLGRRFQRGALVGEEEKKRYAPLL